MDEEFNEQFKWIFFFSSIATEKNAFHQACANRHNSPFFSFPFSPFTWFFSSKLDNQMQEDKIIEKNKVFVASHSC
jgi:hypothetical protein